MPPALSILAVATFATSVALAADLDSEARHARSLAATCANCHRAGAGADQAVPSLESMPERSIVRAMQEFKTGTRPGTVMPQLAKGYSDAQIAAIAGWYARRNP